MSGYVYIMTSEQRPGICKVGRTSNTPSHRCGQLNASEYLSVTDWKVAHSRRAVDSIASEKRAHIRLMQYKLPLKKHREAFEVSLDEAIREVDSVCRVNHSYATSNHSEGVEVLFGLLIIAMLVFVGFYLFSGDKQDEVAPKPYSSFEETLEQAKVDYVRKELKTTSVKHILANYEERMAEVKRQQIAEWNSRYTDNPVETSEPMQQGWEEWEERRLLGK